MRPDANAGAVLAEVKRLPKHLKAFWAGPWLSALPYRVLQLVSRFRYPRYLMVSAISLAVDLVVFLFMLQMDVRAVPASILGYTTGLVVHWMLSSRMVFADKIQSAMAARRLQKLLFVISALLGLVITAAMIECGLRLGIQPGWSKLAAIAVSFHVTYILRRMVIFS